MTPQAAGEGLLERLEQGPVICAEGYLFEFERRGYLQAGAYVPEIVLEHPELVAGLHREFVHAGSDVVEAFTYYAHREKMRIIGKEHLIEPLNRNALAIARRDRRRERLPGRRRPVATRTRSTRTPRPGARSGRCSPSRSQWIVDAGMDFVIAETLSWGEEALLALEVIKEAGLTAVVTLSIHREGEVREGWTPEDACARLGAGRRRRRRAQLHPRPAHDAAVDRADPRRGRLPRRGAAGPVPDDRRRAELPVADRPRLRLPAGRSAVPGRARSVHLQPLRDRGVRRARPTSSASTTSASAAAPGRTTSAASPRRSDARRPPAATAPT